MRIPVICLLFATVAHAQSKYPSARPIDAGMFSIGLTSGNAQLSCVGCPTSKVGTMGLHLFGGGAIDSVNAAGIEINFDGHSETGEDDTFWQILASERYYLGAQSGIFLKGGLGVGRNKLEATDGSGDAITSLGLAYSVGVGIDQRFRALKSMTIMADIVGTRNAKAVVNGTQSGDRMDAFVLRIGVAYTAHGIR